MPATSWLRYQTPEGAKVAQEKELFQTTCVRLVRDAAELLEAMFPNAQGPLAAAETGEFRFAEDADVERP